MHFKVLYLKKHQLEAAKYYNGYSVGGRGEASPPETAGPNQHAETPVVGTGLKTTPNSRGPRRLLFPGTQGWAVQHRALLQTRCSLCDATIPASGKGPGEEVRGSAVSSMVAGTGPWPTH